MASRYKTALRKRLKRIEQVRQAALAEATNNLTKPQQRILEKSPVPVQLVPLHSRAYPHAKAHRPPAEYDYLKKLAIEGWQYGIR